MYIIAFIIICVIFYMYFNKENFASIGARIQLNLRDEQDKYLINNYDKYKIKYNKNSKCNRVIRKLI